MEKYKDKYGKTWILNERRIHKDRNKNLFFFTKEATQNSISLDKLPSKIRIINNPTKGLAPFAKRRKRK